MHTSVSHRKRAKRHQAEHAGHRACAWVMTLAVCLGGLIALPALAQKGKRVAFVVGIGTYDSLSDDKQLKNAVNDAEDISKKLTDIGFQVVTAANLRRSEFNTKWYETLKDLEVEDTFVFFYSGHGVQIKGQNYLLPRDVPHMQYGRRELLTEESISLSKLLADLSIGEGPHPKHSIVILDACRNDPFVPPEYRYRRGISAHGGLARVETSDGMFVIYSAESNRTALDRLGPDDKDKNSVFTRVLLKLIGRRVSIQEMTTVLKNKVYELAKSAGEEQRPTYYDGIIGRFCLPGCQAPWIEATPHDLALVPKPPKPLIDQLKAINPQPAPATELPRYSLHTLAGGIERPFGVAITPAGTVYVGEKMRMVIRSVLPDGKIGTTLEVDSSGQLSAGAEYGPNGYRDLIYVAGAASCKVVMVDVTDGSTKIIAGADREGFSGDNGPATEAQLSFPTGLAVTNADMGPSLAEIFVADTLNHRIRLISLDGTIRTIAGNGTRGSWGDHGPARLAQLNKPTFLAYRRGTIMHWGRAPGELFIADTGNHKVRRVRLEDWEIVTVAGTGEAGFSGDGGPAVSARLNEPRGLALDTEGNLYIADSQNNRIRRVGTDGVITTIAGTGKQGYPGDRRDAREAELHLPAGLVWDRGSIYVSDFGHNQVCVLSPVDR